MSSISSIVDVSIAVQNQGVPQRAYNLCLLLGSNKVFTETYQLYGNMQEVAAIFPPTTPEYVASQVFFAQSPSTDILMIGRRPADICEAILLPLVASLYTYTITVNGSASSVAASGATDSQTMTITNTATSATSPYVAGTTFTATVQGTATSSVSLTGVAATDNAAIAAALQTAGGSQIGTVVVAYTAGDASASFLVPSPTTLTGTAITLSSPTITNGTGTWTGTIVQTETYSTYVLATQLAAAVNANAAVNTIVKASASASGIVTVQTNTPTTALGTAWTFATSTALTGASGVTANMYDLAYVQAITDSRTAIYTAIINGVTYTYSAASNPDYLANPVTATQGLYNVISANPPSGVSVSYNASSEFIVIEVAGGASLFSLIVAPTTLLAITARMYSNAPSPTNTGADGVQTDLTTIATANNDWYAIATTSRDSDTAQGIAAYANSNRKLFGTASSDPNIISQAIGIDTTSIAALLNASGGERSFVMYHQDAGQSSDATALGGSYTYTYPEMAWFGRMLNTVPGTNNWAFKTLSAILPTTGLTTTQFTNIFSKNADVYSIVGGVAITRYGKLATGQYIYIDTLRGSDYLVSGISESVYGLLVSSPKLPYTDSGIQLVASKISQQLQKSVESGYLAAVPAYTVTAPLASAVSSTDKTNRTLNNVSFSATLAGAINKIVIRGTLSF